MKDSRRNVKERKHQKLAREVEEESRCLQEEIKRLERMHLVARVFQK